MKMLRKILVLAVLLLVSCFAFGAPFTCSLTAFGKILDTYEQACLDFSKRISDDIAARKSVYESKARWQVHSLNERAAHAGFEMEESLGAAFNRSIDTPGEVSVIGNKAISRYDELLRSDSLLDSPVSLEEYGGTWGDKAKVLRNNNTDFPTLAAKEDRLEFMMQENLRIMTTYPGLEVMGADHWKRRKGLVFKDRDSSSPRLTKIDHVRLHLAPDSTKNNHGVFEVANGDLVGLLDEAWAKVLANPTAYRVPDLGGNMNFKIPMGRRVGWDSGSQGGGVSVDLMHIRIGVKNVSGTSLSSGLSPEFSVDNLVQTAFPEL